MSVEHWICPDCGSPFATDAHTCGGMRVKIVDPRDSELAALQTRLAEAEAQRAALVAALEDLITRADEADRLLPYGHGLRTLPARQALATQPPSDLVALVKAAATWREAHDRYMDEWSRRTHDGKAEAVHAAVASAIQHETAIKAALDTLLTNQPGFRALIDREDV